MSNQAKRAQANHPILDLLADRWSPYAFDPQTVEEEKLLSCLEAARWAASSYNEQPWSFVVAKREDETEFPRLLDCLLEANQAWAKNAGVLMITVTSKQFSRDGKPNLMAEHDIGLAIGNLTAQATSFGLFVHQMAGINRSKARQTYNIPESHEPLTAIGLGYAANAQRDQAPRSRRPLSEFVFKGAWGTSR
ncbi:MAG: nitroreductase [Planctomycetaceae bacterium]|jgi:nitroreductase|nr:nitroreductase [Planctomycetaceae bacterium]